MEKTQRELNKKLKYKNENRSSMSDYSRLDTIEGKTSKPEDMLHKTIEISTEVAYRGEIWKTGKET